MRRLFLVSTMALLMGWVPVLADDAPKPITLSDAQASRIQAAAAALTNAEAVYAVMKARYEAEVAKTALEARAFPDEYDSTKVVEVSPGKVGFAPKPAKKEK